MQFTHKLSPNLSLVSLSLQMRMSGILSVKHDENYYMVLEWGAQIRLSCLIVRPRLSSLISALEVQNMPCFEVEAPPESRNVHMYSQSYGSRRSGKLPIRLSSASHIHMTRASVGLKSGNLQYRVTMVVGET